MVLERRSVLVTNAHRDSLAVKNRHANLTPLLDAVVSPFTDVDGPVFVERRAVSIRAIQVDGAALHPVEAMRAV